MGGGTSYLGFLTSQPVDVDRVCRVLEGRVGCIPSLVTLAAGEVLVEITIDGGYIFGSPVTRWVPQADDVGDLTTVDGVPARTSEDTTDFERRLSWSIINGRDLAREIDVRARVRRPSESAPLDAVRDLMATWTFVPAIEPLDVDDAAALAGQTVQRFQRAGPGYDCFPQALDVEKVEMVTTIGGYGLRKAIEVRCRTTIAATGIPFWQLEMTARWKAEGGAKAGKMVITQFLASDGTPTYGEALHTELPYCCT